MSSNQNNFNLAMPTWTSPTWITKLIGQKLDALQFKTLIGFAAFGGVLWGGAGLLFYNHTSKKLYRQPYYRDSIDLLHRNTQAIELLGKPIKIGWIDFGDDDVILEPRRVKLKIPLEGKNMSAYMISESIRDDRLTNGIWRVESIRLEPYDDYRGPDPGDQGEYLENPHKGKIFLIYKYKEPVIKPVYPQE